MAKLCRKEEKKEERKMVVIYIYSLQRNRILHSSENSEAVPVRPSGKFRLQAT
jgi:hypothetical protein